jgi:hypothetical protein
MNNGEEVLHTDTCSPTFSSCKYAKCVSTGYLFTRRNVIGQQSLVYFRYLCSPALTRIHTVSSIMAAGQQSPRHTLPIKRKPPEFGSIYSRRTLTIELFLKFRMVVSFEYTRAGKKDSVHRNMDCWAGCPHLGPGELDVACWGHTLQALGHRTYLFTESSVEQDTSDSNYISRIAFTHVFLLNRGKLLLS